MKMRTTVEDVIFGPTVHSIVEKCPKLGVELQPMISGASEPINLLRVGVYYTFPGYKELIQDNGFIGIKLADPKEIH